MERLPLTVEQARTLTRGMVLNVMTSENGDFYRDSNGERSKYIITSVKTWKRDQRRVEVKVKRGMFEFHTFTAGWFELNRIYLQPVKVFEDSQSDGSGI